MPSLKALPGLGAVGDRDPAEPGDGLKASTRRS
jgi:hypothetical protein